MKCGQSQNSLEYLFTLSLLAGKMLKAMSNCSVSRMKKEGREGSANGNGDGDVNIGTANLEPQEEAKRPLHKTMRLAEARSCDTRLARNPTWESSRFSGLAKTQNTDEHLAQRANDGEQGRRGKSLDGLLPLDSDIKTKLLWEYGQLCRFMKG